MPNDKLIDENDHQLAGSSAIDEYKTLRDETLKRVEFRDRSWTLTIAAAGAAVTAGAVNKLYIVLCAYPILVLFFAASYSYQTMMLITIGRYIRKELEPRIGSIGWAGYLRPLYSSIETFERISKFGLFLVTPTLMLAFAWAQYGAKFSRAELGVFYAGIASTLLTALVLIVPERRHARLREETAKGPGKFT
jgi:hypothetical protein